MATIKRLYWLNMVVSISLIVNLIITKKLWLTTRSFPLNPVFESLPAISYPLDYVLWIGLLILLILNIFINRWQIFMPIIGLILLLCIYDQMRWQPWVFHYLLTLIALASITAYSNDIRRNEILNICRLLLICIYFWGGIQKLNLTFVHGIFPAMVQPVIDILPLYLQKPFYLTGYFIPLLEMSIGLGLLFNNTRNLAIIVSIIFHIIILIILGPTGYNFNSVVWMWNISMIGFVIILFGSLKIDSLITLLVNRKLLLHQVVLILAGIMPLFSFIDCWDTYLSWSLYAGNTYQAYIFIDDEVATNLPVDMKHYWGRDGGYISIFNWSMNELNVPAYPEKRIYKNIACQLCVYTNNSSQIELIIQNKPALLNDNNKIFRYQCNSLDMP